MYFLMALFILRCVLLQTLVASLSNAGCISGTWLPVVDNVQKAERKGQGAAPQMDKQTGHVAVFILCIVVF